MAPPVTCHRKRHGRSYDHLRRGSPSTFRSAALAVCSALESAVIVAVQVWRSGR